MDFYRHFNLVFLLITISLNYLAFCQQTNSVSKNSSVSEGNAKCNFGCQILKNGVPVADDDQIQPYLIVASEWSLTNYSTDFMDSSIIVNFFDDFESNTIKPSIVSMDIHIKRNVLIVADSSGNIWQVDLSSSKQIKNSHLVGMHQEKEDEANVDNKHHNDDNKLDDLISKRKAVPVNIVGVDKENLNIQKLTIDWVNDVVYLLTTFGIGMFRFDHNLLPSDGHQFNWFLTGIDTNRTTNIHVDPIGNYMYWSIVGDLKDAGLYRTLLTSFDLANFYNDKHKHQPKISRILSKENLKVFTIDISKQRLYFPENNTIFAMSLTGSVPYSKPDFTLTDVRLNSVVNDGFADISYLVHFSDLFFWFTGGELYHEEEDRDSGKITHNSFNLDEKIVAMLAVHPLLQPYPMSSLHQKSSIDVAAIQSVYRFDSAAFIWTCIASLILLCGFLFLAKKVIEDKSDEKEALKDPERGNESNLISLTQLPGHPHEDNNVYLSGDLSLDCELSQIPLISREQIKIIRNLGCGAFGLVQEGWGYNLMPDQQNSQIKIAVKTLREGFSEKERNEFIKEAKIMANFKHPHILQLLGVCLDANWNAIILELMEGGDLLTYLRQRRPDGEKPCQLSIDDLLSICVDVARGCSYLEEMHFVHRDLAARNCLVSSTDPKNRIVKIGDFGLTRDIYQDAYYRKEGEALLPVRWMAPESLMDAKFSTQSDVWAFGVVLWEVMTFGIQPYPEKSNSEVYHFVRSGGHPDEPTNSIREIYLLMKKCWNTDYRKRPTFDECLKFLQELRLRISSSYTIITSINNESYFADDNQKCAKKGFFNPGYITNTDDTLTTASEGGSCSKIISVLDSSFSCASSQCESISSKYLNLASSSTTDKSGYEIPLPGNLSTKSRDIGNPTLYSNYTDYEISSSNSFQNENMPPSSSSSSAYLIANQNGTILRKSINRGSPPPTYSQVFSGSSSINDTPIDGTSLSSSPTASHCLNEQINTTPAQNMVMSNYLTPETNDKQENILVINRDSRRTESPDSSLDECHDSPSVTAALLKPYQNTTNLYRNLSDFIIVDAQSILRCKENTSHFSPNLYSSCIPPLIMNGDLQFHLEAGDDSCKDKSSKSNQEKREMHISTNDSLIVHNYSFNHSDASYC